MTESTLPQKSAQRRNIRFVIYLLILGTFVLFFRLGDRDMWNGLESESAVAGSGHGGNRAHPGSALFRPALRRQPSAGSLVADSGHLQTDGRAQYLDRPPALGAGGTGMHPPGIRHGKEGRERERRLSVRSDAHGDVVLRIYRPNVAAGYAADIGDDIMPVGVLAITR